MANRGCTIVIKILGGSTGNGVVEDMSLPVALHSPLQVLKDQLMDIVGIPMQDQVLILCNLSDPDRNSDVLLSGRDFETLRACGIRNGSTLTLHALGLSAELKQHLTKQAMTQKGPKTDPNEKPRITLSTPVGAEDADHSYNGVIFDVVSPGPFEVNLKSISIAGMLGRVRIYARDGPWEDDKPRKGPSPHWWAHRESVSPQGWELIADRTCRPSWDKPLEIHFDKPVKLLPHTCRALYCHSGLPDDLGIQYQSYKKTDLVAADAHIEIRPGLGHTGAEPFDEQHGWYRAHRGPAGSISYTVQRKGWTPFEHAIFPTPLRRAVVSLLQCQNHDHFLASIAASSSSSSSSAANRAQSGDVGSTGSGSAPQRTEEVLKMSANDPAYTPPAGFHTNGAAEQPTLYGSMDLVTPACVPPSVHLSPRTAVQTRQKECYAEMARLRSVCEGRRISGLPKFVIYHILEFMHWDWFEECYTDEWDAAPYSPTKSKPSKSSAKGRVTRNIMSALGLDPNAPPGQLSALHQLLQHVGWVQGGGTAIMGHEEMAHMFGSDEESDSNYEDEEEDDEEDWDEEGDEWVEDSEDEANLEHVVMGGIAEEEEEEEEDDEDMGAVSGEEGSSGSGDDSGSRSDSNSDTDSGESAMDVSAGEHSDSSDDAEQTEGRLSAGDEDRSGGSGEDDGDDDSRDRDSGDSGDYQSANDSVGDSAGVDSESDSQED